MNANQIAEWIRARLTPSQLADVAAQRVLVGDVLELPEEWDEVEVMEAVELLSLVRIEACMHDGGGNPDGVTVTRRADEAERTAELMRQSAGGDSWVS